MVTTLTQFSEAERQQALERYKTIKPHLEEGVKLTTVSKNTKKAYSTLYRWVKAYKSEGLIGLIDKKRTDNGKCRVVNNDLKFFIEGLALQKPRPSIASIHRKTVEIAKKNNLKEPSYQTVYNIVKKINPTLITLAQEGTKAYKEKYDLLFNRKSTHPNEIWQADHSLLDIWLIDEKGKSKRPWLTTIIDDYSRAIAGYFLAFQAPNTQNTSLTLHQAIWYKKDPNWNICGIPETFYTDHGSDFTSLHLEQVSADIKMNLSFSLAGQPRGRGIIERFFSTINQLFICELPGYMPDGQYPEKPPTMRINELEILLKDFLIKNYNRRIHSETQMKPLEMWTQGAFIPRMPDTLAELDLLLLTEAKSRKVHQDGIHFHNIKYIEPTLAAYVGEEVVIRYDPRDMAEIRVFHEGKFLCRALSYELAGESIGLKDIIRARNKRKKVLKNEISERYDFVNALLEPEVKDSTNIEKKEEIKDSPKKKYKRYINEK